MTGDAINRLMRYGLPQFSDSEAYACIPDHLMPPGMHLIMSGYYADCKCDRCKTPVLNEFNNGDKIVCLSIDDHFIKNVTALRKHTDLWVLHNDTAAAHTVGTFIKQKRALKSVHGMIVFKGKTSAADFIVNAEYDGDLFNDKPYVLTDNLKLLSDDKKLKTHCICICIPGMTFKRDGRKFKLTDTMQSDSIILRDGGPGMTWDPNSWKLTVPKGRITQDLRIIRVNRSRYYLGWEPLVYCDDSMSLHYIKLDSGDAEADKLPESEEMQPVGVLNMLNGRNMTAAIHHNDAVRGMNSPVAQWDPLNLEMHNVPNWCKNSFRSVVIGGVRYEEAAELRQPGCREDFTCRYFPADGSKLILLDDDYMPIKDIEMTGECAWPGTFVLRWNEDNCRIENIPNGNYECLHRIRINGVTYRYRASLMYGGIMTYYYHKEDEHNKKAQRGDASIVKLNYESNRLKRESKKLWKRGMRIGLHSRGRSGSGRYTKKFEVRQVIWTVREKPIEALVLKQYEGPMNSVFTLNRNDCKRYHVKYEAGLQVYSMNMGFFEIS